MDRTRLWQTTDQEWRGVRAFGHQPLRQGVQGVSHTDRPRVVCLYGSLRFQSLFESERRRLTSLGMIVLAPEATSEEMTPSREALGELHLRRIDFADEVRVVSEGG